MPRYDARDLIGFGTYLLTVAVLCMLAWGPAGIRGDDFFQTIATLIIGAYIKDVVGWAYSSTKVGTELAESQSRVVESNASIPPKVEVVNKEPIEVYDTGNKQS